MTMTPPQFTQYDDLILAAAARWKVPFAWIKAFIGKESSFRPDPPVRPGDPSYGLMQLTPATARGELGFTGTIDELKEPATNIDLGTEYMSILIRRFGKDFRRIYSAYNSGRPDLYLTSYEVATNVKHALEWLEKFDSKKKSSAVASS